MPARSSSSATSRLACVPKIVERPRLGSDDLQLDARYAARREARVGHQRKFVGRQGPGLACGNGECEPLQLLLRTLLDEQSDLPLVHVTAKGERARYGLDGLGACSHDQDVVRQALSAAGHDHVVVRLDGHQRVASQHGALLGGETRARSSRGISPSANGSRTASGR